MTFPVQIEGGKTLVLRQFQALLLQNRTEHCRSDDVSPSVPGYSPTQDKCSFWTSSTSLARNFLRQCSQRFQTGDQEKLLK